MDNKINFNIKELNSMKKYPEEMFFRGNLELLNRKKVSIVGSRHPCSYSKKMAYLISRELSKRGIIVVSGAAMGIDAIAHNSCENYQTIAVLANGLDIKYPSINKKLIEDIEKNGLLLSSYKNSEKPRAYTFVQRNEIVVALGEVLIVCEADDKSGTLTSIEYALNMGKKVFTIPHRLDESKGTQNYLQKGLITPIYDLEEFLNSFGKIKSNNDKLEKFLATYPSYEDAVAKYGEKIFELELEGYISIENGHIKLN